MDDLGDASVALLSDLVAIDSVNPGLVDGAAGESAIVAFLANRLRANGFTVTIVNALGRDDRPSLLAVGPGPSDAPTVVLNGHLDTVGVSGMPSPFTPRVEGHRLFARGAADMKGGVAAMVAAAERLTADHLTAGDLAAAHLGAERPTGSRGIRPVLALVADEEDASLGSEAVIAALAALNVQPDVCLIGEPTDLAPCRTLRGFGVARISFPGRAAHSSQPHLGVNALTHLGRFLHAVDERAPHLHTEGSDLMVTVARGGSSAFVIPDSAECLIEIRTSPDGRGASVLEEIDALLDPTWDATVTLVHPQTVRYRMAQLRRRTRRLAPGRHGTGRRPRHSPRRSTHRQRHIRRPLLDGSPTLASSLPDADLRPVRRRTARRRRMGRPASGPRLLPRARQRPLLVEPRSPLTRAGSVATRPALAAAGGSRGVRETVPRGHGRGVGRRPRHFHRSCGPPQEWRRSSFRCWQSWRRVRRG